MRRLGLWAIGRFRCGRPAVSVVWAGRETRPQRSIGLWACVTAAMLLAGLEDLPAAEKPAVAKEKFHLYLLIGQSNMAGRGVVDDPQTVPDRLYKFDQNDAWVPASDPLHFDKPAIAGVGPGSGFGREMLKHVDDDVVIGLIPCAFGGTPLSRWQPEGDLYKEAVRRTRIAMQDGTLKGVLWHQGEAESSNEERARSYAERLTRTIEGLRRDLQADDLPFVAGELGRFLKLPYFSVVNEQLHKLAEEVPQTAVASSEGATAKSDQVHFDTPGAMLLGRRYAEAMRKLQME